MQYYTNTKFSSREKNQPKNKSQTFQNKFSDSRYQTNNNILSPNGQKSKCLKYKNLRQPLCSKRQVQHLDKVEKMNRNFQPQYSNFHKRMTNTFLLYKKSNQEELQLHCKSLGSPVTSGHSKLRTRKSKMNMIFQFKAPLNSRNNLKLAKSQQTTKHNKNRS